MSKSRIYEDFLALSPGERSPRKGQKDAVNLLVSLSDSAEMENFSIQAPTGTGKSDAALLAGVYNAQAERRTVIGTSTLVLSDQYERDLKNVKAAFPEVEFFVLKGSSNYYCGNKAKDHLNEWGKSPQKKTELLGDLKLAVRGLAPVPYWAKGEAEYCRNCSTELVEKGATACEYAIARAKAIKADVVITTHAMIAVDMRLRYISKGERDILGEVHLTIFDEAHKAADSLVFAESFSAKNLSKLDRLGILTGLDYKRRKEVQEMMDSQEQSLWYTPKRETAKAVLDKWPTFLEVVAMNAKVRTINEKDRSEASRLIMTLDKGRKVLTEIADGVIDGGTAMWWSGSAFKVQDMIPDKAITSKLKEMKVAWLSATVGTESSPTYSLDKCGIKTTHFELDSPFDYAEQMVWTVRPEGTSMPQAELVLGVNSFKTGGTVVLTSSHQRKDRIADTIREIGSADLLVQTQAQGVIGDNGNTTNNERIRGHKSACAMGDSPVIVGVEVFSTGIDLPGQELTKLVIAGLFPLRVDSAYANWRWRWIESFGGNGFDGFELPERAIALEQQIGRLIRRTTDSGVVVFYIEDRDWVPGSKGRRIIEEAMKRFPGAKEM